MNVLSPRNYTRLRYASTLALSLCKTPVSSTLITKTQTHLRSQLLAMALVRANSLLSFLCALLLISIGACALAESSIGQLSVSEIEDALQVSVGQRHAIMYKLTWLSNAHSYKSSTFTSEQRLPKYPATHLRSSRLYFLVPPFWGYLVPLSMRSWLLCTSQAHPVSQPFRWVYHQPADIIPRLSSRTMSSEY